MEGFFVFGFALTTTPVPGPSSPRFPLSLISGPSPWRCSLSMILAFGRSRKVFSISPTRLVVGDLASPYLLGPVRSTQQQIYHGTYRFTVMQQGVNTPTD